MSLAEEIANCIHESLTRDFIDNLNDQLVDMGVVVSQATAVIQAVEIVEEKAPSPNSSGRKSSASFSLPNIGLPIPAISSLSNAVKNQTNRFKSLLQPEDQGYTPFDPTLPPKQPKNALTYQPPEDEEWSNGPPPMMLLDDPSQLLPVASPACSPVSSPREDTSEDSKEISSKSQTSPVLMRQRTSSNPTRAATPTILEQQQQQQSSQHQPPAVVGTTQPLPVLSTGPPTVLTTTPPSPPVTIASSPSASPSASGNSKQSAASTTATAPPTKSNSNSSKTPVMPFPSPLAPPMSSSSLHSNGPSLSFSVPIPRVPYRAAILGHLKHGAEEFGKVVTNYSFNQRSNNLEQKLLTNQQRIEKLLLLRARQASVVECLQKDLDCLIESVEITRDSCISSPLFWNAFSNRVLQSVSFDRKIEIVDWIVPILNLTHTSQGEFVTQLITSRLFHYTFVVKATLCTSTILEQSQQQPNGSDEKIPADSKTSSTRSETDTAPTPSGTCDCYQRKKYGWLSLGLILRHGRIDETAEWPFQLRCTMNVLDSRGTAIQSQTLNSKKVFPQTVLVPQVDNNGFVWGCERLAVWCDCNANSLIENGVMQLQLLLSK
eukprot:c9209_g1_i3.p1 GENE.c9209_g1_i3~~c9209_g1_i3.p1  ORF type:complete len:603 (-),score=192.80 c9209_g1_i3:14-1822(-)